MTGRMFAPSGPSLHFQSRHSPDEEGGGGNMSLSQRRGVSSSQAGSCSEPPWAWTPASPSDSGPACYPCPLVPAASAPPSAPGCSSPLGTQGCPWRTTPGGSPQLPPQTQRGRSHTGRRSVPPSRKQATWLHATQDARWRKKSDMSASHFNWKTG